MNQDYDNLHIFILDDSDKDEYINQINNFYDEVKKANNKIPISIIRRENRKGFKAGNINSFLKQYSDFDYFVLLDSDEIICNDFCKECIKIFNKDKTIGIVQANHVSNRYENKFEKYGSLGVFPGSSTILTMKNNYGIATLYGHGAMVKKECYYKANGFPEIVSEDIGFVVDALAVGYRVEFANNIICDERFPIDYISFKKRATKWTQGNLELLKAKFLKILKLKINFFRKLDLILNVTSISFNVMSFFLVITNLVILAPLGFKYNFFFLLIIFMVFFIITPFFNQIFYYLFIKKQNYLDAFKIIIFNYFLFPSIFATTIWTIIKSIFGVKAKFIVTPKDSQKYTVKEALQASRVEIIFSILILTFYILSFIFIPSVRSVSWFWLFSVIVPSLSSPFLVLLSNLKVKKENGNKKLKKIKNKKMNLVSKH